jgi:hypothetical protein
MSKADIDKRDAVEVKELKDIKKSKYEDSSNEELVEVDAKGIIVFRTPVKFEGVEYEEINLSGIRDLNMRDWKKLRRLALRENPNLDIVENSVEFAQCVAVRVTGLPFEFFELLPLRDAITVRGVVLSFLMKWE